ncbi:hypothetical protein E2C01_041393 [Portunus trituberculatus]|uniref:Uncharacterized protein n=1 Tax=Portunus trituberculatus TaxID=210409 RepID=A0A5B7FJ55_PORTR|nr:hypothetical protein [Portunus trituberculatus]
MSRNQGGNFVIFRPLPLEEKKPTASARASRPRRPSPRRPLPTTTQKTALKINLRVRHFNFPYQLGFTCDLKRGVCGNGKGVDASVGDEGSSLGVGPREDNGTLGRPSPPLPPPPPPQ